MRKALNIMVLLFMLTALAFGLVGCDGNADQAKADEMMGTDVKLNGTWKSQNVTYTHDGKQYSGQIELRFNDDQMQIVAPYGTSKIHRYTRNGIALNITDPYVSEDNPYRTFPFALEFDSTGFAVDLGALTFMEGANNIKLKFTKIGALAGDLSEGVPSTGDIRTKSDLLSSIPGFLVPPSSDTKNPDEATVSLINSVLDRLNSDYYGEATDEKTGSSETNLIIYDDDFFNGYVLMVIKVLSEYELEQTINGRVTADGKEIVFDNFKIKMNDATGGYSESGSVTVNGKSADFEYAINLLPKNRESMKGYWSLDVSNYRSGTYSVFSEREIQDNEYNYSDGIVVLDITAYGHKVQLKYTCPSDASSFRYGPDCSLDYVAVDDLFYNTAKIQEFLGKLPDDIKLSSTLMEFDTFAEIQGCNLQLTAEITLRDGSTSKDVVWETPEDTSAFKVQSTSDGVLTFQIYKSGTYVISAHADYEGKHFKTAQCVITINDALTQLRIYDVTNDDTYMDDNGTIELRKGQTVELSPIYTPTVTPQLDVLWCVDNASVATLSGRPNHKVVLTAIGPGTATVTLMSQENTSIRRKLNVVVVEEPKVPGEPEEPEVPEAPISDNIHYGLLVDELPKDLSDISLTVVYQEEDGTPVRWEDSVDLMLHAGEELTSWYLDDIENRSVEQYVPEGKVYFEGSFPVKNNGYYILSYYIYGTNINGEKVLGYSCAESHKYTGSSLDTEIRSSASAEYDYGLITAKAEGACYAKIEGYNYVVVLPGTPVTFTSKENLSSYWWDLNGTTETETSNQYTLECPKASDGSWMYGIYRVSCTDTGLSSSSSVDVIFTPNKDMEEFDWNGWVLFP